MAEEKSFQDHGDEEKADKQPENASEIPKRKSFIENMKGVMNNPQKRKHIIAVHDEEGKLVYKELSEDEAKSQEYKERIPIIVEADEFHMF